MDTLQRFNVAIGAVLCILIWFLAYKLEVSEGAPRFLAVFLGVIVFCVCAFLWKPTRLNDRR